VPCTRAEQVFHDQSALSNLFRWRCESQRWKPQVDYSSAPVAGCKSNSVAAVTVAKPIAPMAAPKRRVTSHYGKQAIVINKADEAV
jgi:hypothetical protein